MTPDIILLQEPFPHVIIKNVYNENELRLIWRELEFLTEKYKLKPGSEIGAEGNTTLSGINLSQNFGLTLDEVYRDRNVSDILTTTSKIAHDQYVNKICEVSPLVGHLKYCNMHITKVKYYESGNYYRGHWDASRFTFLTYLFKEPKLFTGGDLYFDDYDYTIEIENNMTVFFVGSIIHSSKEVKLNSDVQPWTGGGKYCITQFIDYIDPQFLRK
jgi:Rps23 Pro-64 3,4-dihydroxylase Tpa1-like proline 4-hydroxylase